MVLTKIQENVYLVPKPSSFSAKCVKLAVDSLAFPESHALSIAYEFRACII